MVKLIINPIKTRRGFIMKKILILSMSLLAIGQSFAADGITGLAGKAKDGAIENAGKAAGFVGEQAGKAANYVGEQAGKGAGYVAGELGKAKTFAGEQAEAGKKALVAGFHQRADNNIFSPIPLEAFSRIKNPQFYFALLCGSSKYKALAEKLRIKNIRFIKPKSDELTISKFLNTLDIFAHGRKDGETFGTVFAEAMMHKKPCLSHWSPIANAHKETMGPAGLFAKDLDDYTEKLHSLFTNHELRKKLALSAKPFAEKHYSLQAAVKNLAKIYHDVYKKHKSYKKSKFKYAIHAYNNIDILVRKYGVARKIKKVITNPKLIIKKACYLFTKDDI